MRYKIAALVQAALAGLERRPKLVLNLADLHFLREIREAAVGTPGFDLERARATQSAELAAIRKADLTLTYSDVEAAVIGQHTGAPEKVALAPWTVETRAAPIGSFADTDGLMFLGGFGHPPNAQAVIGFVQEVMPLLADLPDARLLIVGSKPTPEVLALTAPRVEVLGYVADLDEVFATTRIFVAPLISGAGLKGKVIEALARGVPMVLTPMAAEGTGLVDGAHCLIARTAEEQAAAIAALYADEALWTRLAEASLAVARERFSFHGAVETLRAAMARIGVETPPEHQLHYHRALPDPNRGASSAPAVMRLP
jgi:glycosyltransferase involved in cell wall biosynthesis